MSQNGYIKQSKTLRGSLIARGLDGRGIVSIAKTGTAGLVDTYTITYSDNTTSTFTVTNGANGEITSTSFAPVFSSSTAYAAGDYVVYSGQLYQFTTAHAAGAWNASHATAVQIADQVSELKSAIEEGLYYGIDSEDLTITQTQGYYMESTTTHKVIGNDTDTYSYKTVLSYNPTYTYYVTLQTSAAADCIIYADDSDNVVGKDLERISSTLKTDYKLTVPSGCTKIYITTNRTHNIEVTVTYHQLAVDVLDDLVKKPSAVLRVSADGYGDYRTVQAAIDAASEGDTIVIYPGTYPRFSNYENHKLLHIVGVDKNACVIYDDSSDYRTPPVAWCNGTISNLTIIEDHSNPDPSLQTGDDEDGKNFNLERAYSIHMDGYYAAGKTIRIENCIIKNTKRAAIGMGLKQDNTVEIINCDIWSGVPTREIQDIVIKRGAWYVHNASEEQNVTGQKLFAANNRVYCDDIWTLYIGDFAPTGYTNECEMTFVNNLYYSKVEGTDCVVINSVTADWTGKNIDLGGSSYGNNTAVLNA